jgi:subtilisin family serine protease
LAKPVEKGEYASVEGTSISTPIVASMAAILKSYDNALSPDEAKSIIRSYAVPFSQEETKTTRYGYLDLEAFSKRYINTETKIIKASSGDDTYYVEVDIVKEKGSNTVLKTIVRKALKKRHNTNRLVSLNEEVFQ